MKPETLALLRRMQNNEATDQRVYAELALRAHSPDNRKVLERIARDEERHCAAWGHHTGEPPRVNMFRVRLYTVLARIFGVVFAINLLESGEDEAAATYRDLSSDVPEAKAIMEDEIRHEGQLAAMIREEKLSYISSMVLGLNDALVELTGALAGFTLALNDNRMVGMAGFITGVAATLSMAASEYLAKKADPNEEHPLKAATYTGMAYLFTVALLLLPYLVVSHPLGALAFCLINAGFIILGFTYFVSVVRKQPFLPAFREMLLISFSVAAISFLIGWGARVLLDIDI